MSPRLSPITPCVHAIIYVTLYYFNESVFFFVYFVVPHRVSLRSHAGDYLRRRRNPDARRHTPTSSAVLDGGVPFSRVFIRVSSGSASDFRFRRSVRSPVSFFFFVPLLFKNGLVELPCRGQHVTEEAVLSGDFSDFSESRNGPPSPSRLETRGRYLLSHFLFLVLTLHPDRFNLIY